ncbi:MAG: hypothetical protein A3B91_01190 [Candidatus Yanofskybacteria bacterium RIFCSPHIGHO2_02_FULL_41_29]|uniref:Uncharacterized protein n=1 Tax=Candidatus Yanofskybacteria bacterium RIFCSPHIGHO2_01_FULL_41_53 TaxID=1802663 RepID=A0A1F8EF07_9BACT|nr:MAG: hypothetical protein A2650_01435 [Candidatus Yanofskybacteria bacterium RIFCSPHIGHO2_01_FULL_41_53]OGN11375.1 MAG: hypothetical protein A3B91_01190 [Candidatus Yanofskybacteria bacterium RIFCSPHIGHO2_02_FULL_41_29]OGN17745.1 MAG: hypothetical protein A3F48_00735 [Candidatus Yanofskybacteria bacterium RIFCSPHIGHO2_12_FULL_41_9]OGN24745.1 MAG: hypothetical protein A2916_01790 [Candidatus Yanofskybacteria bacterium RIFCSPLOWO2_01_FULL_41_67]OGN28942.1 MAG: hypothetical protein A3H54_02260 
MFILIPSLLILCSVLGIAIIIWRKKSYIKKLYSLDIAGGSFEMSVVNGSSISAPAGFSWKAYGADFFPEIKVLIDKLGLHKYKTIWLREAEKILRKTRLVSLRVDNFSDSLIKKIRRVHINGQLNGKTSSEELVEDKNQMIESEAKPISPNFLKNEEQRLVMEIAKNPKNPDLYESLGDLYIEMDNFVDAKESYEAAIELSPQKESLKIKLSGALERLVQTP